ncbi:hypothetical protein [Microvirga aerophila]|uniref:Uncharacterized protein n=2 Tax=Microvirga aerophila TaxID=670291 RepID=A0A512BWM5_9HYPH|nr:hypothetical protein [Microvirga aerophila]GEO16351.1 hypothetical protein MAE02_40470 [Microvirga aerophila]
MAYFDVSNDFGQGFNMSATGDSGFSFVQSDPSITEQLIYDQNGQAIWKCLEVL